ncbi:MAG: hypothetical protein M3O46_17035 [Myxococcota bacterium]|nr:hypothetical protein [Myxococcota bacterium]
MLWMLLAAPTTIAGADVAAEPASGREAGTVARGPWATESSTELDAPHRFRSGVALGLTFGGGLVGASGYPNEGTRIGDPNYYSSSGWMFGSSESFFLMGALTDYLNFGLWYAHASSANRDWRSSGDGAGIRVEAFPMVTLLPRLAGLGLLGQFGVGVGNLSAKAAGLPRAEGTQSFLGAGVLYEWSLGPVLGGHFGVGPSLQYDTIWSQPFERHGLVAGARVVFYGGP